MKTDFFEHKVALITGSAQGIGKAIAIEFIKNRAAVVINGRNPGKLLKTEMELKAMGGRVLALCGDVSDPAQAKAIILKAVEHFGRLDFLINNAGISMLGNIGEIDPEAYGTVFKTNVMGPVNSTSPALPHLREAKGSVVFISSVAAIRGLPGHSAYSASKMALRAIAESLKIEEATAGVHVGLIHVGFTQNHPEKKTLDAQGNLVAVADRKRFKIHTQQSVALAVLKNIRKRKFSTTLTNLGKLNRVMNTLAPRLVEGMLSINYRKGQVQ